LELERLQITVAISIGPGISRQAAKRSAFGGNPLRLLTIAGSVDLATCTMCSSLPLGVFA
jgi:hypothetical protein